MKKFALFFTVFTLIISASFSEQVSKLDFTGSTRTEKVVITINDNEQSMLHQTPSRDSMYAIIDYDVQVDLNNDSKILTATVIDQRFNTAFEIVLYANSSYSDIRIGKKYLAFNTVQDFRIQ